MVAVSFAVLAELHPLAGGAHTRFDVKSTRTVADSTVTSSFETGATNFATAFGGGLDVRLRMIRP